MLSLNPKFFLEMLHILMLLNCFPLTTEWEEVRGVFYGFWYNLSLSQHLFVTASNITFYMKNNLFCEQFREDIRYLNKCSIFHVAGVGWTWCESEHVIILTAGLCVWLISFRYPLLTVASQWGGIWNAFYFYFLRRWFDHILSALFSFFVLLGHMYFMQVKYS